MLDIKFIRDHVDLVKDAARKKNISIDIDRLLELDAQRRELLRKQESARATQNAASETIAKAKGDEKKKLIAEMKTVSQSVGELKDQLLALEDEYRNLLLRVPQIPASHVQEGDERENKAVKVVGEVKTFDFPAKDHMTLGKELDLIDFERGVKIMGTRGYLLKGDLARLEQALIAYALEFLRERGFMQVMPPVFAQARFLEGTGHFPFAQAEVFKVFDQKMEEGEPKLFLIGTSEVPLTGLHADEVLEASTLPRKYMAVTPCFRTEVGSYGRDTQGLYRVKQFMKVEQVIIGKHDEEQSSQLLREILKNSEDFLASLELPYRLLQIATGDMGAGKVEMFDIETWMPSRNKYGETHSASNLGDWQARRLNIRYKDGDKNIVCDTLNNTLMASPRILIPLMEYHQQKDGSIYIPQALRPYMNGQAEIRRKS